MKKQLAIIGITSLLYSACNKKHVTPISDVTQSNQNQTTDIDYKYYSIIRVYDNTKQYYADISVKSNNKDLFDSNVSDLNNSKLEVFNAVKSIPANPQLNDNNTVPTDIEATKDASDQTIIKIMNVNRGTYNAIKLVSKINNQFSKTNTTYWGVRVIITPPCLYYYTSLNNGTIQVTDYAWTGSTWFFVQYKVLPYNTTYYFSGTGYVARRVVVNNMGDTRWHLDIVF